MVKHVALSKVEPKKRRSRQEIEALGELLKPHYEGGMSFRELAAVTGLAFGTVRNALRAVGTELRPVSDDTRNRANLALTEDDQSLPKLEPGKSVVGKDRAALANRLRKHYEAGATTYELGARINRSDSYVGALLHEAGVVMRRPGTKA